MNWLDAYVDIDLPEFEMCPKFSIEASDFNSILCAGAAQA
jgi:hypothetical protein